MQILKRFHQNFLAFPPGAPSLPGVAKSVGMDGRLSIGQILCEQQSRIRLLFLVGS